VKAISWPLDDRVVIRSFEPSDGEHVFSLVEANRMHLRPWMPWEITTRSVADSRAFITRSLASEHDLDANGIWVDGELAGSMGIRVDPMNDLAELGYWVAKPFEGRGLITRAARRFVEYGFAERKLHRIEIHAAVGNERSRAVAERLGFRQEGTLREAIKTSAGYLDVVIYAMLSSDPLS
jgi:ribosomal-protein-serine acetyltransferase